MPTYSALVERLFTSALNLAELRRGGLFVVLADLSAATDLLMSHDRLDFISADPRELPPQDRFNYLLRGKSALDLTPTVLESIARFCVTTRISARSLPREDGRRPLSPLRGMGTCRR
jgi:hypothetical protein